MSNVLSFSDFQKKTKSKVKDPQFKKIEVTQPKSCSNELTELYLRLGEVRSIVNDQKKDPSSHPDVSYHDMIRRLRTIKDRAHSLGDPTLSEKCNSLQQQVEQRRYL